MADYIWGAVTSDTVLTILAGLIFVAATVGYLPIVSNLSALQVYVMAARMALIAFVAVMAFIIGFRTADLRAEVDVLKLKVEVANKVVESKNFDLALAQVMTDEATAQRDEASQRAKEAQDTIDDYAQRLKARPNPACLLTPDDFSGGVRNGAGSRTAGR